MALRTLFGSWRGRLFLVNLVVFIYVCWRSQSLFLPDTETLIAVGAKDPVKLAAGQWWRLVTPVFIHVGLLHFAVNSYMLNVVGRQLEQVLGGVWFIVIYLVSGVAGNVASAIFSANLSAGASGAIFGLLGAGLLLEQTVGARVRAMTGKRPAMGAYFSTIALNLAFGFIVPFVDNSAHLGGLVAGYALGFAMVRVRANNLAKPRPALGYLAILTLAAAIIAGGVVGTRKAFVFGQLARAGKSADEPREGIFYYTEALEVDPGAYAVGIDRARLLFKIDEPRYAYADVREALQDARAVPLANGLADELNASGKLHEATMVRSLIERREDDVGG